MGKARELIEKMAISIANHIMQFLPTSDSGYLPRGDKFYNGYIFSDKQIIARQAALDLVLRALICHLLDATNILDIVPASYLIAQSNKLLENLGLLPHPFSKLDELYNRANIILQKADIAALANALQCEQGDILGKVYTSWIPQNIRRPLGQFWTPWPIARLITWWTIRSPSDYVLDPAFGSGVLLMTAIERLTCLGASIESALQQVAGVELSPSVFLLGLANILLRYAPRVPRLKWADFLMPERKFDAILMESSASYLSEIRQMALSGLGLPLPTAFSNQFDAIVCNPPYTRHHHLPEAYKSFLAFMMEQEYGIRLSRFSSLFAYFFLQASKMLSPTGRMAFITPVTVFEAFYSKQIKLFIKKHLRLRAIVTFDETCPVFEGVDAAVCITMVEGPNTPVTNRVVHVQIRQWPGVEPILQIIERGRTITTEWGNCYEINLAELKPSRKWTVNVYTNNRFSNERFIPLSTLARVIRGIATGANKFFVLSDEEVVNWGLRQAYLRPVLTKTREVPGYVFTQADFERLGCEGKKRWLLYLTSPVIPGTPEARYIRYGEALGIHKRSLVKNRTLWYLVEQRAPAPIYFTYLSRKRSRFIYNKTDALALNAFLCIYPDPIISQDETMLKALLAILNSLIAKDSLRYIGRSYGGDSVKIEPREMDRLPILNPKELTLEERKTLAHLFDRLSNAKSEEDEKAIRGLIDDVIADIVER